MRLPGASLPNLPESLEAIVYFAEDYGVNVEIPHRRNLLVLINTHSDRRHICTDSNENVCCSSYTPKTASLVLVHLLLGNGT